MNDNCFFAVSVVACKNMYLCFDTPGKILITRVIPQNKAQNFVGFIFERLKGGKSKIEREAEVV